MIYYKDCLIWFWKLRSPKIHRWQAGNPGERMVQFQSASKVSKSKRRPISQFRQLSRSFILLSFLFYWAIGFILSSNSNANLTNTLRIKFDQISSASTSAAHGSLHGGVIQTLIPERSGPLEDLPKLGCFSFPLTLITRQDNTKRCLKKSPVFQP